LGKGFFGERLRRTVRRNVRGGRLWLWNASTLSITGIVNVKKKRGPAVENAKEGMYPKKPSGGVKNKKEMGGQKKRWMHTADLIGNRSGFNLKYSRSLHLEGKGCAGRIGGSCSSAGEELSRMRGGGKRGMILDERRKR